MVEPGAGPLARVRTHQHSPTSPRRHLRGPRAAHAPTCPRSTDVGRPSPDGGRRWGHWAVRSRRAQPPVPSTAIRTLACSQHERALGERSHPPWVTPHGRARTPSRSTVEPRGFRTGCWTSPRTLLPSPRVGQAGDVRTSRLPRGRRRRHPDERGRPSGRRVAPTPRAGLDTAPVDNRSGHMPTGCPLVAEGSRPGNSSHPGEPRGREPRHARSTGTSTPSSLDFQRASTGATRLSGGPT
jgi:hypothetical protein